MRSITTNQFTIEQVAGDFLGSDSRDAIVATTFNFLNQQTAEGGAQAKEYQARYMTDRVNTLGTAWLGQTFACAECHDHKFDPVSTRDFYQLQAFFADIEEQGKWTHPREGYFAEQEFPIVYVGSDEQMSELRRRKEILDKALEEIPYETLRDDARVHKNRPREDQRFFIGFDEWVAELVEISESRVPLL